MAHLIDKDAVLAEIKEWLTEIEKLSHSKEADDEYGKGFCDGRRGAYRKFLSSINTLEVKEVDLDFQRFAKEMDEVFDLPSEVTTNTEEEPLNWEYAIAKHFFELGLSTNNPVTASDRGTAEEIIINLKRVEQDYHINLTKEIEWVRNKVKKGE